MDAGCRTESPGNGCQNNGKLGEEASLVVGEPLKTKYSVPARISENALVRCNSIIRIVLLFENTI